MRAAYDVDWWHRKLCLVTGQIIISGDLSGERAVAGEQINHRERVGITHVLDTRSEWSDKDLVADRSPAIVYGWTPTDDFGGPQLDRFDAWLRGYSATGLHRMKSTHREPGSDAGPDET